MKTWPKTGIVIAALCCAAAVFAGCDFGINKINVYGIKLSTGNMVVQSGAPKTLTASVEPYFAADLGILFVKDDPDGLISLSNQTQLENPWEFEVTVSAPDPEKEGTAKITAMSLDGSKKADVSVTVSAINYKLTVRNLNTGTLNSATTPGGELVTWKGGKKSDAITLTNFEPGARFDWHNDTQTCFLNSTIAYLTHADDDTGFTGDFTFRTKIKFTQKATGGAAGFFFGVFKDPTVDPAEAYTGGIENVNRRFRVQGIRVQTTSGSNLGVTRKYFTTNGNPTSTTNPRNETPTGIFTLTPDTEYTFEVVWDGVSTYSNKITFSDGTQECAWEVKAATGTNNINAELTDPAGVYYPAFYAAGVEITLTELTITE
jgi:hypothetical protein